MEFYPRFVTSQFKPYDPLELAKETENIVCKVGPTGLERKYTSFYATGVYRGIATGYACGCCLRCIFCWVDWSRDFPEKYGRFYSPEKAFHNLIEVAEKYGVNKLRISGAEPTLGKRHLLKLLEYVESSHIPLFILETNGILFGADKKHVEEISKFKKVHVRVSLKAGTPEGFSKRTGAIPERFELPYQAIKNLLDSGVSFHVASMSDPRLMSKKEREQMIKKLFEIDKQVALSLEEEICDPYETTIVRLSKAGINVTEFFKGK